MAKQVVIEIHKDGSVVVEANGFKGSECTKATQPLIELLAGGGSADTKPKPDYYQSHSNGNMNRN